MNPNKEYLHLITDIKNHIASSRYIATKLVNQEQLKLYLRIGWLLEIKFTSNKWGSNVIEQIAEDLQQQVPGLRGFSYRNLRKMRQFYQAYAADPIWPLLTARLRIPNDQVDMIWPSGTAKTHEQNTSSRQSGTTHFSKEDVDAFLEISFTHHLLLLSKCSDAHERLFYMRYTAGSFCSVSVLEHHIQEGLYRRQGKLPHNFTQTINKEMTNKAIELFKDEYLLDFLNLTAGDDERKIESEIVTNIRDFILRMGKGFAFISNQFRIEVGGQEFYIDLLFYNRILQCLVVFELKKGNFKPGYTGQLNFYLNVLDDKIKLSNEHASIGIILCKERNDTVVQYSLRTTNTPIGVAKYKISTQIPQNVLNVLPDVNELKRLI